VFLSGRYAEVSALSGRHPSRAEASGGGFVAHKGACVCVENVRRW